MTILEVLTSIVLFIYMASLIVSALLCMVTEKELLLRKVMMSVWLISIVVLALLLNLQK